MATLVTMSEMNTFDLHAVRHHQPSGCGKESSGLSKYHQRKHSEGHSHGSHHLIASIFSSAEPWSGMGVVIDADRKALTGSLEPPVYMLASLVKLVC